MNLYVDIGNSRIKMLEDSASIDSVVACYYTPENLTNFVEGIASKFTNPGRIFVANVAGENVARILDKSCVHVWGIYPIYLNVSSCSHGVTNGYRDFRQLGIDRWLAIISAWNKFKSDLCIVDCGSAITIDIVSADGQHHGGYIIPGRYLMQKVLASDTSQLEIATDSEFKVTAGRSTAECIHNGTTLAVASFIENIYQTLNAATGKSHDCVITGGGAGEILNLLNMNYNHEPLLVLDGIRLVSNN